jgi:hypothetical protein
MTVTYQEANIFGTPALAQNVTISSPDYNGGARAGLYRLTGSDGFGDFLAFCVDLAKNMGNGKTYNLAPALFGGATLDNIDRLYTSVYSTVDTALEAAGFQVALWEIVSDTATGFDLSSGDFAVSGNANAAAQAQGYLDGLAQAQTGGYTIDFLTSGNSQNLVTGKVAPPPAVNPVPLPAAGWMLLAGFGGLFGLRRGRKSQG